MAKIINLTAENTQITPVIHAVQSDTARELKCYIDDIDISTVTNARIYALKPDGTDVYNDCVINTEYITAPLTSQTLAAEGKVKCQLQLTIGGTITTFLFNVIVDKSLVLGSAIESSNEYTALENALDEVNSVIDGLPSKVSKAGDTMSGTLYMGGFPIKDIDAPVNDADAATKSYVDTAIANALIVDTEEEIP